MHALPAVTIALGLPAQLELALDASWPLFGTTGAVVPQSGPQRDQLFAGVGLGYRATELWLIGIQRNF